MDNHTTRTWRGVKAFLLLLAVALAFSFASPQTAQAAKKTGVSKGIMYYKGAAIATVKGNVYTYIPQASGNKNYNNLTYLLKDNKKKTVVIPKGANILVNGPLRPGNNKTIVATGATLTFKRGSNAVFTYPKKKIKNLSIYGGTWLSKDPQGRTGSMFVFAFANNCLLDGVTTCANYTGHSVEIIASTNITVRNCTIDAIGNNPASCLEEQIQIDLATKKTAPKIAAYGAKFAKGQTCKNIYILNNEVTGARAIDTNWTNSEGGKYINCFHENVVIRGNTLIGTTSEALAYFNCTSGEIVGNTCVTNATRTDGNSSYTIGIHVAMFGKPATVGTLTVAYNTAFGLRNAISFKGYENYPGHIAAKYGTVNCVNNTCYCVNGATKAIDKIYDSIGRYNLSGNRCFVWKKA